MSIAAKLEGRKFGRLTVIERVAGKKVLWKCKCDCGSLEHKVFPTGSLTKGNTKSCGCIRKEFVGRNNPTWSGYEEMSGSFLYSIENEAKERGWEYSITPEYIWDLFIKQGRKCALTGLPLTFEPDSKNKSRYIRTASLDRIDSEIGYVEGNVQWVHKIVNITKQRMNNKEFLWLSRLIVSYYGENKDENITTVDVAIASTIQSRMGRGLK